MRHRLGGPEWPERALQLQAAEDDDEFRGMRVLRSHTWLAWSHDEPVGYLGGEVYDRWTTYDGSDPDHPVVTGSEPGPAMGSAYVVDPARWRRGFGVAVLRAWVEAPEVADVRVFALGIEHDNLASTRCALAAGFVPDPPGRTGRASCTTCCGADPVSRSRSPAGRTSAGARSPRSARSGE